MTQTLHIFRKDARQFLPQILTVLALLALRTLADALGSNLPWERDPLAYLRDYSPIALVLAWTSYIASLIHAEPLTSDRPFWLTRPYRRSSLIAAKALSLAAFILIPFLLSDCLILAAKHIPPSAVAAGLLTRHLQFLVILFLPAAALAAVTRNLTQFFTAALAIGAAGAVSLGLAQSFASLSHTGLNVFALTRVFALILPAAAIGTLFLQYRSRWTLAARACLATALLLCLALDLLPPFSAIALRAAVTNQAAIQPEITLGSPIRINRDPSNPNFILVGLPLAARNLPPGFSVSMPVASIDLDLPDGSTIHPVPLVRSSIVSANLYLPPPQPYLMFRLDRTLFAQIRNQPLHLHASLRFTLVDSTRTVRFQASEPTFIANYGFCQTATTPHTATILYCDVLKWTGAAASVRFDDDPRAIVLSAFHSSPGDPSAYAITLVDTVTTRPPAHPRTNVSLTISRPAGHFKSDLDIPNFRLADYRY